MPREEWIFTNLYKNPLSLGFLGTVVVPPGRERDLLSEKVTKDQVRQSDTIKGYLDKKWAKIERVQDGVTIAIITAENIHELSDAPEENLSKLPKLSQKAKLRASSSSPNLTTNSTNVLMSLPDKAPEKLENGKFCIYQEGESLVIEAKDKEGRVVKSTIGKFQ